MTTASLELRPVQLARKAALCAAILLLFALFILTRATLLGDFGHDAVVNAGRLLICVCIIGRAWCSLYIGGRKIAELVQTGPYSICRNPLYTLSIIGAAGAASQTGSLALGFVGGFLTWLTFRLVVAREETTLFDVHGATYAAYLKSTPRFLPNFGGWRDCETVEVRPRRVVATFLDGVVFLAFVPIGAGLAHLADAGITPTLLQIF